MSRYVLVVVQAGRLSSRNLRLTSGRMEPSGGVRTYLFLPIARTTGTRAKITVGTRKADQYPWSRARNAADTEPAAPKFIAA